MDTELTTEEWDLTREIACEDCKGYINCIGQTWDPAKSNCESWQGAAKEALKGEL